MTEIDLVKANCKRILELLEKEHIEYASLKKVCGSAFTYTSMYRNNDNIELRQRLKMLRKDTLLLEPKLTGEKHLSLKMVDDLKQLNKKGDC